jgi:hypothetical protein
MVVIIADLDFRVIEKEIVISASIDRQGHQQVNKKVNGGLSEPFRE